MAAKGTKKNLFYVFFALFVVNFFGGEIPFGMTSG